MMGARLHLRIPSALRRDPPLLVRDVSVDPRSLLHLLGQGVNRNDVRMKTLWAIEANRFTGLSSWS